MRKPIRLSVYFITIILCAWVAFSANAADDPKIYTRNNVLAAGNYNDGFGSSDITLIIQLEVDGNIIFDEGAEVKYLVPDADAPRWTEPNFDDSGWTDGITSVGYADGDDNTQIQGGAVASVYTRYEFDIPNASSVTEVTFRADFDDSYILWLNGVEIARTDNIATLSPVGEIPAWDVSSEQWSMQHIEATTLPAGQPNDARWNQGSIGVHTIAVKFSGPDGLFVEPQGNLIATWGSLKN